MAKKWRLPSSNTEEGRTTANLFPLDSESQYDTHTIEEATAEYAKALLQLPSAADIAQHEIAYLMFKCASGPNDQFLISLAREKPRIQ